jgi:hypothetical protein
MLAALLLVLVVLSLSPPHGRSPARESCLSALRGRAVCEAQCYLDYGCGTTDGCGFINVSLTGGVTPCTHIICPQSKLQYTLPPRRKCTSCGCHCATQLAIRISSAPGRNRKMLTILTTEPAAASQLASLGPVS